MSAFIPSALQRPSEEVTQSCCPPIPFSTKPSECASCFSTLSVGFVFFSTGAGERSKIERCWSIVWERVSALLRPPTFPTHRLGLARVEFATLRSFLTERILIDVPFLFQLSWMGRQRKSFSQSSERPRLKLTGQLFGPGQNGL